MPSQEQRDVVRRERGDMRLGDRLKIFAPILIVLPAIMVLAMSFHFATQQLEETAEENLIKTGEKILTKTENLLGPASFAVNSNAIWVESMFGKPNFARNFHKLANLQMETFPHYGLIYFGDTSGNHWSNKREFDGSTRIRIIRRLDDSSDSHEVFEKAAQLPKETEEERQTLQQLIAPFILTSWYHFDQDKRLKFQVDDPIKVYDPRLRPWYFGAERNWGTFWTNVYTWENKVEGQSLKQFGITISTPVMRHGQLIGVTAIDLILQAISDFLEGLKISRNGRAFIFDSTGLVVGLPDFSEVLQASSDGTGGVERTHLSQNRDPATVAAYQSLRRQLRVQNDQPLDVFERQIVHFSSQGEQYFSFFEHLGASYQLDWYVGVLMPQEDIKGPLKQQFRWILLALGVIVLLFLSLIPLYMKVEKERRFIRNAFSKYVSPNRVDFLLENPQHLSLGGEYRQCSFVMTDLSRFTALMEEIGDQGDPAIIVDTLNEYLEGMVKIAFKHEGTLDRIVGDAVAVLFSAPVKQADHAERALRCALEMDQFATLFAAARRKEGLAFGHTRIGVNSGRVLLGNFGGKVVFDYRALGDPVNTAARLETINDQLGTRVCVSAETVSRLPHFYGREVGDLVFKGKQQDTKAFQPLSEEDYQSSWHQAYLEAFTLMAAEDPGAEAAFAAALQQWPEDPLSKYHYNRLTNGERGSRIVFSKK